MELSDGMKKGDLAEIRFPVSLEELPGMKERQGKQVMIVTAHHFSDGRASGWWEVLLDGKVVEVFNGHLVLLEER